MVQVLISKDRIAKELKVDEVTLREIYEFCERNDLKVVAVDQYFVIAEDMKYAEYKYGNIMDRLERISKHFNDHCY